MMQVKNLKGDWTQWRHDPQRTGRASVAGQTTRPEVAWRRFIGCREDWVVVKAGEGGGSLGLPKDVMEADFDALERQYDLGKYIDVDGSGRPVKVRESLGSRYHRLLPGVKGYQRVTFQSAFQVGNRDNYGWLESFEEGLDRPRRVWETERDQTYYQPQVVFTDVDGDGRDEIVMTAHYRIIVFDPDTGKKRQALRYHDFRNYGDLHAADLDGDGLDEFVQLTYFQTHLEVIDNDGGELKLAWFRDVNSEKIRRPTRVPAPPYNPVGDVDGDGRPEVVCTFFDMDGDLKWHVVGFEGMTGERKVDLLDVAMVSMEDVDGDGVTELFCVDTPSRYWPETVGARLVRCKGGQQQTVWERPGAGWLRWRPPVDPPRSVYGTPRGAWRVLFEDVDGDGRKEFFTYEEGGSPTVRAWRMGGGSAVEALRISGVDPEMRNVVDADRDRKKEMLLQVRRPDDRTLRVETEGCRAVTVASRRLGWEGASPPLVLGNSSGSPVVVTLTAADEVVGLGASSGQARVLWRHPGHGMEEGHGMDGGFCGLRGLASIDEDGDGVRHALVATSGPGHCARLQAVGMDGRVAWHRDFPMFRHRPISVYYEGLFNWEAGRFFGRKGEDLLACFRWYAPTVEGHAVRGDTRETVWERNHSVSLGPTNVREFGDRLFATVDRGEGDDIVSGSPDFYYIADGRTGEIVVQRTLVRGTFPIAPEGQKREADWWVSYSVPILVDLDGDGVPEALLGGGPFLTAVLRLDGAPIWHGEHVNVKRHRPMQGVGDVDGDGRLEVGSCEPDQGFVCFDGATGKVRWTWPDLRAQPSAITSITTCDVDGDGLEEFLLPTEKELIAFNGKGGKANVVWRMALPAACREVVAADADGDGQAEVLMPCSDGYLYCVR